MEQVARQSSYPVERSISLIEQGIISTLIYFDLFRYPLTKSEIHKFCHTAVNSAEEMNEALGNLVEGGNIFFSGGFYFINDDRSVIERRKKGNARVRLFEDKAIKYADIISRFPFVRGVFISGSLSKGFMDEDSDIDFFIITKKDRLWLCRTLLVIYKKIFLLNSHKYFCVNYFIDDESLEIPDKNVFTATEIVTLKPMYNPGLCNSFRMANSWTKSLLPNANISQAILRKDSRKTGFKYFLEKIFSQVAGNALDNFCLRMTTRFWKKKFSHFSESDFLNAMRSKKNVSKHHPNKFQEKVLTLYRERMREYELAHNFRFSCPPEINLFLFG